MFISEVFKGSPQNNEGRDELEARVYAKLDELQIEFTRVDNESVEAMDDCKQIDEALGVEIRKTIVLCNRKKTEFYLVALPADKPFDTKKFSSEVGCSRMSFASADSMADLLGVRPGSATIMGVLNDVDEQVKVVIDREVVNGEYFGCNPGVNTSHICFKTTDLVDKLLPSVNHSPIVVDL